MKTVRVVRDVSVKVGRHVVVAYQAGKTYRRVPEAHAREILRREAGELVPFDPETSPGHTDMMVSSESLDAFMAANPLPPDEAKQ